MKPSVLIFSSLLLLSVFTFQLSAQPAPGGDPPAPGTGGGDDYYRTAAYGVGLNVGLLSGAGLSGRATFPGGFSAQLAFFVMTLGDYLHFNVGGEAQYGLIRKNDNRLYALLGMGLYSSTLKSDTTDRGNVIANPFRVGLGLGYEYFTSQNFVIAISGAITYFPTTSEVYPLPEIGFFWYFR